MNSLLRLLRRMLARTPQAALRAVRVPARTSRLAVVVLLVLATPAPSAAQASGEGGVSLVMALPQGRFASVVDGPGVGMTFFGGIAPRRSPILVGAEIGFIIYGYERRREPWSYTIPDVGVDVVTSNNIFLGHLLVRLRPPSGPVRPYVDALFGLKYLFTTTDLRDDWYYDDPIATTTNFEDAAPSYGVGGGIDVQLTRGRGRGRPALYLHAGVRYLVGGQADYLLEGSIRRDYGRVSYEVFRSETSLVLNEFGLTLRF